MAKFQFPSVTIEAERVVYCRIFDPVIMSLDGLLDNKHSLSNYCVAGIVLRALHELSHLIFTIGMSSRHSYYSHFTVEATEANTQN